MSVSGRNGRNGRKHMIADINVTPLVDVMLVLLIIFMVTAPMMTQGMDVNLPATTAEPLRQNEDPVIVTVNSGGEIFLNKIKCDRPLLRQQLTQLGDAARKNPIYLRADRQVPYGVVVGVMADIKGAGFEKLGMVTQPEEEQKQ